MMLRARRRRGNLAEYYGSGFGRRRGLAPSSSLGRRRSMDGGGTGDGSMKQDRDGGERATDGRALEGGEVRPTGVMSPS